MSELERQLHLLHSEIKASRDGNFTAAELRRRAGEQATVLNMIREEVAGLSRGLRYVIALGGEV